MERLGFVFYIANRSCYATAMNMSQQLAVRIFRTAPCEGASG
jgi:hypothetical protein